MPSVMTIAVDPDGHFRLRGFPLLSPQPVHGSVDKRQLNAPEPRHAFVRDRMPGE